jgi:hypothetical protein
MPRPIGPQPISAPSCSSSTEPCSRRILRCGWCSLVAPASAVAGVALSADGFALRISVDCVRGERRPNDRESLVSVFDSSLADVPVEGDLRLLDGQKRAVWLPAIN